MTAFLGRRWHSQSKRIRSISKGDPDRISNGDPNRISNGEPDRISKGDPDRISKGEPDRIQFRTHRLGIWLC
jgi:hypothetical protein